MIIRSSIKPQMLKRALWQGTLIGALGLFILLFGALFISKNTLSYMGAPLLLLGLSLIGFGLYPYKKLVQLEWLPYEFRRQQSVWLFSRKGKVLIQIPHESIEKMEYKETEFNYGIFVYLKEREKIKIFDRAATSFITPEKNIFLQFFSKTGLDDIMHLDEADDSFFI